MCQSRGRVEQSSGVTKTRFLFLALPALSALVAAGCSSSSPPTSTTTTSSASSTTSTTSGPTAPAGTPVPAGFEPASATFVSSTTGFVIGIDSTCAANSCVAVARTTDEGAHWVALSSPPAAYVGRTGTSTGPPAVSKVRFADELDGWVYGPALFATHDGGATWQAEDLGGSVISLETSGGYVDALLSPCTTAEQCSGPLHLYQAPVAGGSFSSVLTGPSTQSNAVTSSPLSLHAPVGFADMSGTSGPGQASIYATGNLANPSRWLAFPDPCAASTGSQLTSFVAPDTTKLFTLCAGQGAAGSVTKAVVETQDGTSKLKGAPPAEGDPEEIAATADGVVVVTEASGASVIYRSSDSGSTWTAVRTIDDGGIGFSDLGLTTSTQGIVIHGWPGPPANFASQLLITHDAGESWQVVPIG